jgi:hypothetical protein
MIIISDGRVSGHASGEENSNAERVLSFSYLELFNSESP